MSPRPLLVFLSLLLSVIAPTKPSIAANNHEPTPLAIFDAHIHYNHDVWDSLAPEVAIRLLREAGITRALVSSTSDEGTQKLYQADPEFVIPSLRPYRKHKSRARWMYDESTIPYLKERLKNYQYAAMGEFHLNGKQANTPIMVEVIQLAKQYKLILHVHSDARAVEDIFKQDPDARILWAHAGFENTDTIHRLMDKHPRLWADLSFRFEMMDEKRIVPEWEKLLIKHADRFLLGIDTYTPQRWVYINDVVQGQRELLAALPDEVARKIAYENGQTLMKGYNERKTQ